MNTNNSAVIQITRPSRSPDREADERFFHFKNVDQPFENGRVVGNVTCFTRRDKVSGQAYASFAECDERDQFNKRTGRTVARRKWFAAPQKRMFIEDSELSYEGLLNKWTTEYTG